MLEKLQTESLLDTMQAQVELLPGLGWAAWPDGTFAVFSDALEAHLGMSPGAMAKRQQPGSFSWKGSVHDDEYDQLARRWAHSLETGEEYNATHRVKTAQGNYKWLRTSARAEFDSIGRIRFWIGISLDIDDSMTASERLRASEENLRRLIDCVPAQIWSANSDAQSTYVNRTLRERLPLGDDFNPEAEISVRDITRKVIHPEDLDAVQAALQQSFETGERFSMKYRHLHRGGGYGWIHGEMEPYRDHTGEVTHWYGACRDIDDEVTASEKQRQREQGLRLVVDTLPAMVWTVTPEGEPSYYNKRLEVWGGLAISDFRAPEGALLNTAVSAVIHPNDQDVVERTLRHSFASGLPWSLRYRQRRADGVYRWIEGRMEALRDSVGHIVQWYGLSLDIEGEVRAQESLRLAHQELSRASQLAGLAELSASIAHEVNQPLASVVASSAACRKWLSADPPNIMRARMSAETVTNDANAASDVVKRIRALFQQRPHQLSLQNINETIATANELLENEFAAARVQVHLELAEDLPTLTIDTVQIQQVVVNLMRNGAEAMGQVVGAGKTLYVRSKLDFNNVLIEVEDLGNGIVEPEKIFQPFYTTKADGMGLGLSISRSVVQAHGGRFWAVNTESGARFSFSLPLHVGSEN